MSLFLQHDRNIGSVMGCDIYNLKAFELPQYMIAFPVCMAQEFFIYVFSVRRRQSVLHLPDSTLRNAGYGHSRKPQRYGNKKAYILGANNNPHLLSPLIILCKS